MDMGMIRLVSDEIASTPSSNAFLLGLDVFAQRDVFGKEFEEVESQSVFAGLTPSLRFGSLGNVVLNGQFFASWSEQTAALTNNSETDTDFYRDFTRLTVDFPSAPFRVQLGDLLARGTEFQTGTNIFGMGLGTFEDELQPLRDATPIGRRAFQLQRRSQVDVFVNGNLQQNLILDPGQYTLDEIPLIFGQNNVELRILDDRGQNSIVNLSVFSSNEIPPIGKVDFGVFAGVEAYRTSEGPDYQSDRPILFGFANYGLTTDNAIGISLQADKETRVVGGSLLNASKFGDLQADIAFSDEDLAGTGYAVRISYQLPFREGQPRGFVSAAHNSEGFRTAGQGGTFFRSIDWEASTNVNFDLSRQWSIGIGARYEKFRGACSNCGPDDFSGFRRSADEEYSGSISLDYQSKNGWFASLTAQSGRFGFAERRDETIILAALRVPFGEQNSASVNTNSFTNQIRSSVQRSSARLVNDWTGEIGIEQSDQFNGGEETIFGNLNTTNNRFSLSASHEVPITKTGESLELSSLSFQTALGVSDRKVSWGRYGFSSFAIIEADKKSFPNHSVVVDQFSDQDYRAKSGALGAAFVSDLIPYTDEFLTVKLLNEDQVSVCETNVVLKPSFLSGQHVLISSETGSRGNISKFDCIPTDDKGNETTLEYEDDIEDVIAEIASLNDASASASSKRVQP